MDERSSLTGRFEANRTRLHGIAYRMLGSLSEAEDAVQEAWLRLNRSEAGTVDNLDGWLTTVVSRVCLDMLRSRRSRREQAIDASVGEPGRFVGEGSDPESEAMLADSVGVALLVVLDTLTPAERLAFVLHDLFDRPFEEIAPIMGRSPGAVRQLASRARRRVRGAPVGPDVQLVRQREVVAAFLQAARAGDLDALLAVLDPDAVVRIDAAARIDAPAAEVGMDREVRGASVWARQFVARADDLRFVGPALIDGSVGLIVARGGRLVRALTFQLNDGLVTRVEVIGDPGSLRVLDIAVL